MSQLRRQRCPDCGFLSTKKTGLHHGHQRYFCTNCGCYFTAHRSDVSRHNKMPWFRDRIAGKQSIEQFSARSGYSVRHLKSSFHSQLPTWINNGWKPLVETAALAEPGEFERVDYEYSETDDGIQQVAVVVPDYAAEIAWNKNQLDAMDWKTTRNTIAEKAGMPLPIPWETLYVQTQTHRDRINELERQ